KLTEADFDDDASSGFDNDPDMMLSFSLFQPPC
ncbi:hypothetical protein Tco_1339216, partial [Tanacetum coccineum]